MRDLHLKIVLAYAVSALALLVAVGLAYCLSQAPIVNPEPVVYTTTVMKEVGGNWDVRMALGWGVIGAGVVSVVTAGFGFHASRDHYS